MSGEKCEDKGDVGRYVKTYISSHSRHADLNVNIQLYYSLRQQ